MQVDGSEHARFEDRRPKSVLMPYIDDAANQVYGRFYGYEGPVPAMDSFMRYARTHGLPGSIYLDKHSTYKSHKIQEDIYDEKSEEIDASSQFGRAMKERVLHRSLVSEKSISIVTQKRRRNFVSVITYSNLLQEYTISYLFRTGVYYGQLSRRN